MNEPLSTGLPGVAGLPPGNGALPPADVGSGNHAAQTVPRFGGLRAGRKRADGLVPGSDEALAADREKERLRKARQRARQRAENPPALPAVADDGEPLPGLDAAPLDTGEAPGGDLGGVPGAECGAPVPWDAASLAPLIEQLLPTLEAASVARITRKAAAAKLPADLLRAVENDSRWPKPAAKVLQMAGPQLAAKWLNKTGVSAEHQLEVAVLSAVGCIVAGQSAVLSRLEKIIAEKAAAEKESKP